MNGNNGIVPTVDLATNNNNGYGYPYPVMPMMYGGYGYGNNNGFFGGDGIWAIVLLALLFGNNGFGGFGGNGWNNIATTDYISSEFTQRDINGGFQNQSNLISNGFSNAAQDICNLRSEVLENRYANQLAEATTQRDILMQTTQLENQASINALNNLAKQEECCCRLENAIRADGEATRDLITSNTIQDLRDKIADKDRALQTAVFNASQIDQTATLVNTLAPRSIPAYITSSPYQSIFNPWNNGFGWNNGFYGNGFFGNTIV